VIVIDGRSKLWFVAQAWGRAWYQQAGITFHFPPLFWWSHDVITWCGHMMFTCSLL